MSRKGTRSSSRAPQASPEVQEEPRDPEIEDHTPGNGAAAEEPQAETAIATEEPAQVQLTIKGSDKSAREAAKRFGEGAARSALPVIPNTSSEGEPEDPDPIGALLSDGKNMVIVTRQRPRTVQGPDGQEHATNVRIPGRYTCPTSQAEIEELVFDQHGGSKYKCTIHPDTAGGENKILGHFTIEHPDSKCPPYISGVTTDLPEPEIEDSIPTRGDPTLRETDPLVKMRETLQRRLERAQMRREIEELEAQVEEIEGKKPSAAPTAPAESEEIRKLREENAKLAAQLAEKKVNDRFDRIEGLVGDLAKVIASKPAEKSGEDPTLRFIIEKMKSDDTRIDKLTSALTAKQAPVSPAEAGDGLDKMLDRLQKLQALTGTGPNKSSGRLSELESRLIDMSWKKLTGGGDDEDGDVDPEDMESVAKLAIKQFAPIAKTFVEKKLDQASTENGGAPLSKEQIQRIYAEASEAATKKIQDDLSAQGLRLAATTDGKIVALPSPSKKPAAVPPRQAPQKVEERKTQDGTVKIVRVQPENLSGSKKPAATAAPSPEKAVEGEEEIVQAEFPGLGPNGGVLKVEIPPAPGSVKYDRKRNVDFILDSIRSEILQRIPNERPDDSFVIGDAMELLDAEILEKISKVETGEQMEAILSEFGDPVKINEIKEAGKDEPVKVWLRRIVMSMGDAWRSKNNKG